MHLYTIICAYFLQYIVNQIFLHIVNLLISVEYNKYFSEKLFTSLAIVDSNLEKSLTIPHTVLHTHGIHSVCECLFSL